MIQGRVSNLGGVSRFAGLTASIMVKVVGTDITAPVSAAGEFSLEGVPTGDVKLEFTGGATTLVGNVNTGDRIDIQVRISGATAVVEAAVQIRSDSTTFVDGTVTSASGNCPNRTIVVNDWTLTLTNSNQATCADVRVGAKVKIRGSFTSNKTIVIVKIEVLGSRTSSDDKDSDDDDSDDGDSDSDRRRRLLRSLREFTLNW